ncbi:hypothetical protein HOLleu_42434 [Holothuria leucospilota]|uniref:Uncharacterized protein n=1 Tax=Holothuria leucospilota TaxID=206669 RepID=A0A9Q0YI78_HOLLE|nr:hypothetical protein HOLleu_42434 [Holothuria leucospilota]
MVAEEVAPALGLNFQISLDTGTLSSFWLCPNISPILKKGDRSLALNYRPVFYLRLRQNPGAHYTLSYATR